MADAPQTVRVYDKRTGHPLDLSPEDAQRAFQNGQAGFKKGDRVPIRTADGDLGTVEAHELAATLKGGGELASDQEFQQADDEARYGGFGNELRTGVEGAARNVSLGLSDAAMVGLGADRKGLEGRKRANPWSEGIGEAAGLGASLLIPGLGEADAARAAGGVAEIGDAAKAVDAAKALEISKVDAAGSAAAKARELEKAASFVPPERGWEAIGNIDAARGVETATAKEAAAAQAARTAAEADHAAALDKFGKLDVPGPLRVGVGKAFEYSPMGLVGKLGNAAEKGVADVLAIDKSSGLLARTFGKAAAVGVRSAIEGGIYGDAGQLDEDILGDHEITGQKLLAALGHGALYAGLAGGALGGAGEVLGSSLKGLGAKVSGRAEEMANEQAFRALGAREPLAKRIEKMVPGGIKAVGETIRKDVGLAIGDTAESIVPKVDAALERVGDQIGKIVDASGATVSRDAVLKSMDAIIAPLEKVAFSRTIAQSLKVERDAFAATHAATERLPFKALLEERRALGKRAYQEAKALDPSGRVEHLREIQSSLEKHELGALDDAQKALGSGPTVKEYKDLKGTYQKLKYAKEALENRKGAGALTNRMLSPTDHAAGIGGAVAGELAGEAAGHMLAGGVIGSALGLANKALRHTGNASASVLLGKIADLGAIQKTVSGVDARITEAVDGALTKPAGKRVAKKLLSREGQSEEDEYDERKAQLSRAVAQPEHMNAVVSPMVKTAPNVALAFGNATKRATAFLTSKLPHESHESLTPNADPESANPEEIARFLRYARAVDDPTSVLAHLKDGTLTSEEMEAAEAVYPDLVKDIRAKVATKLAEKTTPMPLDQETSVRLLLDLRTGPLDPAFVAGMQGSFPPPGPGTSPGKKGAKPTGLGAPVHFQNSTNVLTSAQQSMQGTKPR